MSAPARELARVALIGGNGAVGRRLGGALLASGCAVRVLDLAGEPDAELRDRCEAVRLDVRRPSQALTDALGGVDCVVLAVPEHVALEALPHVLAAIDRGALLVDTLSVKTPFVRAARAASAPVEILSINPMFAPSLAFAGQTVLAVEVAAGPRSRALIALIESWGAAVVLRDESEHDRATAALQAAAHAALLGLGLGLNRLDANLDELLPIAPPPFAALLALLARIAGASPETYWDVQAANPHAAPARAALAAGLADLDAAATGGDPAAFAALLADVTKLLGGHREALAATAATLVAHARPSPARSPGDRPTPH